MVLEPVLCPDCQSSDVVKHGQSAAGKQCYRCRNPECRCSAFVKHYSYPGYLPEVKQQITEMALNGSGIRDTAQVLSISPTTVIEELKKSRHLRQVNSKLLEQLPQHGLAEVVVERVEAVEMDEMWSFVGHRKHQGLSDSTPMVGAATLASWMKSNIKWARVTPRGLSANTLRYALALSG